MDGLKIDDWRQERIATAYQDIERWTRVMADNEGNRLAQKMCQEEIDRARRMLEYMDSD